MSPEIYAFVPDSEQKINEQKANIDLKPKTQYEKVVDVEKKTADRLKALGVVLPLREKVQSLSLIEELNKLGIPSGLIERQGFLKKLEKYGKVIFNGEDSDYAELNYKRGIFYGGSAIQNERFLFNILKNKDLFVNGKIPEENISKFQVYDLNNDPIDSMVKMDKFKKPSRLDIQYSIVEQNGKNKEEVRNLIRNKNINYYLKSSILEKLEQAFDDVDKLALDIIDVEFKIKEFNAIYENILEREGSRLKYGSIGYYKSLNIIKNNNALGWGESEDIESKFKAFIKSVQNIEKGNNIEELSEYFEEKLNKEGIRRNIDFTDIIDNLEGSGYSLMINNMKISKLFIDSIVKDIKFANNMHDGSISDIFYDKLSDDEIDKILNNIPKIAEKTLVYNMKLI